MKINFKNFKKIKDIINKLKLKISPKLLKILYVILPYIPVLSTITYQKIIDIAERIGLELNAEEIHHILHVVETLGHHTSHLFANTETEKKDIIND